MNIILKNGLLLSFIIISLFLIGCSDNSSNSSLDSTVPLQQKEIGQSCVVFSDCKLPFACNFDTGQCEQISFEQVSATKCFDFLDCKFAGTYCKLSDEFEYDEISDIQAYVGHCEKEGCDDDYDCATGKVCDLENNVCQ